MDEWRFFCPVIGRTPSTAFILFTAMYATRKGWIWLTSVCLLVWDETGWVELKFFTPRAFFFFLLLLRHMGGGVSSPCVVCMT